MPVCMSVCVRERVRVCESPCAAAEGVVPNAVISSSCKKDAIIAALISSHLPVSAHSYVHNSERE